MTVAIEALKALAPFSWPLLSGLVVLGFHREFRSLLAALPATLSRVKIAKAPGIEVELNALGEITSEAESEVGSLPEATPPRTPAPMPMPVSLLDQIRDLALQSPRAAIALCKEYVEKEIRQIMATMGLFGGYAGSSRATLTLEQRGIITPRMRQAVGGFLTLTDGSTLDTLPENDVRSLLSNGLNILALLKEIPRSKHRVHYSGVPIYSDPDARVPMEGASGVILQAIDEHDHPSASIQIFPTTKPMIVGTDVSWEWNLKKTFPEAWFRNPETNEITHAWTSAGEFIGRDLNEI